MYIPRFVPLDQVPPFPCIAVVMARVLCTLDSDAHVGDPPPCIHGFVLPLLFKQERE